jgi:hypothetical protein
MNLPSNVPHFTHNISTGTFACGGTTVSPSLVAVSLRCGWSLGGTEARYLKHEDAMDQYLGRVMACLPQLKADFATLPPHFHSQKDTTINETINRMFPHLVSKRNNLKTVSSLLLASLVYHADWLKENLPSQHPVFSTAIFRDEATLRYLRSQVTLKEKDSPICATGTVNLVYS